MEYMALLLFVCVCIVAFQCFGSRVPLPPLPRAEPDIGVVWFYRGFWKREFLDPDETEIASR